MKNKTRHLHTIQPSQLRSFRYFATPVILGLFVIQSASAVITTWSGAADDSWATAGNWSSGLPTGNDVVFSTADATGTTGPAGTVNNVVDANTSVATLRYNVLGTTGFHTTQINSGVTLTTTGGNTNSTPSSNPNIFVNSPTTAASDVVYATIKGGGTLLLNNAGANLHVGQGTLNSGTDNVASTTRRATLDLSGLTTFNATLGRILLGQQVVVGNRPNATIRLATTNTIDLTNASLPGLLLGDIGSNNGTSQILDLGITNTILTDTGITIGGRKGNGILQFNSAMVAAGQGTATFRSRNGTGRMALMAIADNSAQSAGNNNSIGTANFSVLGEVDALVDTLTIGRGGVGAAGGATLTLGTLTFDAGIIDANNLNVGVQSISGGSAAKGIANVDGAGELIVNNNLVIGRYLGGIYMSLGVVNIGTLSNGGKLTVKGDVINGSGVGNKLVLTSGNFSLGGKLGDTAVAGNTALETLQLNGGTFTYDFGSSTNTTGTRAQVQTLEVNGPVTLSVKGANMSPGTIELIKYATISGASGFSGLTLDKPSRVDGTLVDNTANNSVDFVITAVSINKWSGTIDGDWDIDTKENWKLTPGNTPSKYLQTQVPGEVVTFDDTAAGTKTINLTTVLSPQGVTVNTAATYDFTGTGGISGPAAITKQGSGTLVIGNTGTNDFTGAISIEGGKIQIGSADRLPATTAVTLAAVAGAELDLNSFNQTLASLGGGGSVTLGSAALTLRGAATYDGVINGTGSLTKSGTGTHVLSGANLYSGGTTISGGRLAVTNTSGSGIGSGPVLIDLLGVLAIGNGTTPGSVAAATITNNGRLAFNSNEDLTFSKLIEGIGILAKENTGNSVTLETANTFSGGTAINGGGLRVSHKDALGTFVADPLNPTIGFNTSISNDPTSRLELEGGIVLPEPLTVATKGAGVTSPAVLNVSGNNTLSGPIDLTTGGSFWNFQSDADKLTITGTMTNIATTNTRIIRLRGVASGEIQSNLSNSSGNLSITAIQKEDAGIWNLAGNNTNTGATTISAGTLLINGSHASSPITVAFGATLGGGGTVGTITSTGSIAPGNSIGTLNAGDTTLNGVLTIEVSGASSDLLNVTGTLALNASTVAISGTPVASAYTLATATSITGTPVLETEVPGYELVIEGNSLKLKSTSAESPYQAWATLQNLVGDDALPAADPDKDDMDNSLEFVLGGNPKANDQPAVRPQISTGATSVTLTFKRSDASELQPIAVKVQASADLATWNPADDILIGATDGSGPNGSTYTVDETGVLDTIVVTIPKSSAVRKFVRVQSLVP